MKHLVLPLAALGITLALAATAQAQNRQYQGSGGTSASLQITFGSTPHWTAIAGTRVREIRQAERPDYDMFRYGNNYYVYNNNRWYMSRRVRGNFAYIEDRRVPSELTRVPQNHWRNYPMGWKDQNGDSRYGRDGRRHYMGRSTQPSNRGTNQ
jgi:hypothetical protein